MMQGPFKLLSCSGEGDVRKRCSLGFVCVVGMVLTASLCPAECRDMPAEGIRVGGVREI